MYMLLAWRPCQLEPPAAAAAGAAGVMEAPLTGSHLPREQCCHQGAAGAPPHLVPLEANRYIMRLLVLSSLCPCSIKAPSLSMCCPCVVLPCPSARLLPVLFHLCQFRMHYGIFLHAALKWILCVVQTKLDRLGGIQWTRHLCSWGGKAETEEIN